MALAAEIPGREDTASYLDAANFTRSFPEAKRIPPTTAWSLWG
ncbi:MAG: hypothetical protein JG769_1897 [Oscillospiraceae bacterium]|nr:hypothetical protein [Oscillospiraceae bacterium]